MTFNILQHLDKLEPDGGSNTPQGDHSFKCPSCGSSNFKVHIKSGKYATFGCDCSKTEEGKRRIRHALSPSSHKSGANTPPSKPIRPKAKAHWDYNDIDGNLLIRVHRSDDGLGKRTFRQSSQIAGRTAKELAAQVVPYRLKEALQALEDGAPFIAYAEGEGCVDAIWALGLPAITSLGGCNGFKAERDGGHIDPQRLVIVPDQDQCGLTYAKKVAEAHPGCKWLLPFRNSPHWEGSIPPDNGLDIADWLEQGATAADVMEGIQESCPFPSNEAIEKPCINHVGKVRSAAELLTNRKPTDWLIDQFAARGCMTLIGGATGTGKTTFLYAAAQAISTGSYFMNELTSKRGKALVIQADESETNCSDKLDQMGINPAFDISFDPALWNLEQLTRIQKEKNYDAILADSLTTLLSGQGSRFNDAEFGLPCYGYNHWASEHNVWLGVASHLRKQFNGAGSPTVNDIYGAGTQTWAASDVWTLHKPERQAHDDHVVLHCVKARFCEQETIWNLQGSKEDFSYIIMSTGKSSDLLPKQQQKYEYEAYQLLSQSKGKHWHSDDVAAAIGCNKEHSRRVMRGLRKQQRVERHQMESTGGRPRWVYFIPWPSP